MKCPKCQYVGFEESDRCRHCGYDFSLNQPATPLDAPILGASQAAWTDAGDASWTDTAPGVTAGAGAGAAWDVLRETPAAFDAVPEAPLPLFAVGEEDQPLVRLPAVPRRPIAVRRTPETPRLRAVPKPLAEAAARDLLFDADEARDDARDDASDDGMAETATPGTGRTGRARRSRGTGDTGAAGDQAAPGAASAMSGPAGAAIDRDHESVSLLARVAAAVIDHGLLAAIDLAVVYFTLRMAGLTIAEWRMLPSVPFGLFLLLIGFAYFGVFTTFGGQTIGKMLLGIHVVPDPHGVLDYARALRRTSVAVVSLVTCGLAYLPAGFGDRRTLHDRVAGTRVVRRRHP